MELWNDFEGKSVDGRFHLDHLIGPKGRSAYFTTKDETGAPAVIRLIESLNDEEEILGRWRTVTGLKQEHLVEVLACGQTVLDGTHLVYAVMEPTDAELADVLRERALTPEETRQVALSVADGLEALHARGLVHEHVDAENVLAREETVKLRSDVARQAPDGPEGAALRSRDVRDFSLLLSYALTRSKRFGEARLPVPFEEVVRKGESGSWNLQAISAALQPIPAAARQLSPVGPSAKPSTVPATSVAVPGARPSAPQAPLPASAGTSVPSPPAAGQTAPAIRQSTSAATTASTPLMPSKTPDASTAPASVAERLVRQSTTQGDGLAAHLRAPRAPDRIVMEPESEPKRTGLFAAIAAGLLILVLLGVHFFRASRAGQSQSVVQDAPAAVTVPQQSAENRPPANDRASTPTPHPPAVKPSAATGLTTRGSTRTDHAVTAGSAPSQSAQWRVVAFTYNHEEQATQKVQAIAVKHPNLKPEVFSSGGRSPFLVTLGGWLTAEQAAAVRNKARSEGLPRDVYTQNYRGKGR